MSNPRYRPRAFTLEPFGFGRVETIKWDEATPPARLRAAQLQHQYAIEIRTLALKTFGSIKAYAETIGQSEDRLLKVLRGDAIMRLEDLAAAQVHLGWTTGGASQAPGQ